MTNLIPVPVMLTIFGAALTLIIPRRPILQRVISIGSLSGVVVLAAMFMWATDNSGPLALWIGNWPIPLGITLVVDGAHHECLFGARVPAVSI